jgi:hypothetical protein
LSIHDLEGSEFRVCEDPCQLQAAERQARAAGAHVLRAGWRAPDYELLRSAGFVLRPDRMFAREVPVWKAVAAPLLRDEARPVVPSPEVTTHTR